MKINHTVAAVLLMGPASGEFKFPRGMVSGNRLHTERAPRGSAEEAARIAEGDARRAAKLARRAARVPK